MNKTFTLYLYYTLFLIGAFNCWSFLFKTVTKKQNQYKFLTYDENDGYRKCNYIKMSTEPEGGSSNISQSFSRFNPLTANSMLLEAQRLRTQAEEIERANALNSTFPKIKAENKQNQTIEEQITSENTKPKSALSPRGFEESSRKGLIDKITSGKPVVKETVSPPRAQVASVENYDFKQLNKSLLSIENLGKLVMVEVNDFPIVFSPEGLPLIDVLYEVFPWYTRWMVRAGMKVFIKSIGKESDKNKIFYETAFLTEQEVLNKVDDDEVDGDKTKSIQKSSDGNSEVEEKKNEVLETSLRNIVSLFLEQETIAPKVISIAETLLKSNTPEATDINMKDLEVQSEVSDVSGIKSSINDIINELKLNITTDELKDVRYSHKSLLKVILKKNNELSKSIINHLKKKVDDKGEVPSDVEEEESNKLLASSLESLKEFRSYASKVLELPDDSNLDNILESEVEVEGEVNNIKVINNKSISNIFDRYTKAIKEKSESTPSSLTDPSSNDVSSLDKSDKSLEDGVVSFLENAMDDDSQNMKTLAESMVVEIFDKKSRKSGDGISREGGARFQSEILKDSMTVSNIISCQGSLIFEGTFRNRNNSAEVFCEEINQKLQSNELGKELNYILVTNERYGSLEGGLQQMALESFLGSTTSIIVYPKTWELTNNALANDPLRKFSRNLLSIVVVFTSAGFAASCFNIFSATGPLAQNPPYIPDDILWLTFLPIVMQYIPLFAEIMMAKSRGVKGVVSFLPSTCLPLLGSRVTYIDIPKSRKDTFDIAAVGYITGIISSLAVMIAGIQLTLSASPEELFLFPELPLSVLKVDNVVAQFTEYFLPNVFDTLVKSPLATIHLHWIAISGAVSLIANTLQMIPLDNSAGSKLTSTFLKEDGYTITEFVVNLCKGVFIFNAFLSSGLSLGESNLIIGKVRILIDFLLVSQIANVGVNKVSQDNITPLSEGRKIIFFGLIFLLFYSFFSFSDAVTDFQSIVNSFSELGRSITGSGGVGGGLQGTGLNL